MPDKNGLYPGDEGFDHEYMDERQEILAAGRHFCEVIKLLKAMKYEEGLRNDR